MKPLVIGHRGSPGHLPDHTLEGYRLAVQQGADFIEPDLVCTRDGALIARHENDLTHTTDVGEKFPERKTTKVVDGETHTGWFSEDFTLAEIRTLRAVQPFPSRPHEHDGKYGIPTFEEILDLREALSAEVGREIGVYPETKHPSYFRALGLPIEGPMVKALKRAKLRKASDPVILQSFEWSNLERLDRMTGVRKILLVGALDGRPFGDARTYAELLSDLPARSETIFGLGVHKSYLWDDSGPTDRLQAAHDAGLAVHVYTFRMEPDQLGPAADGDPRTELRRFYELGVDGVFADYPDVAVEVRDAR